MVLVSQNEILGSILPDVYISRITLQTSGDDVKESSPHVDVSREPNTFIDSRTGRVRREFRQPAFSKKASNGQKLNVTVDCVLKERLTENLFTSWFGDIDFSKYIRIKIIQVTDGNLARAIARNKSFIPIVDSKIRNLLPPREKVFTQTLLARELNMISQPETVDMINPTFINKENLKTKNRQDILLNNIIEPDFQEFGRGQSVFLDSVEPQILKVQNNIDVSFFNMLNDKNIIRSTEINVPQETPKKKQDIRKQYLEIDDEGNEVYSFLFQRIFTLKTKEPEHLSYFAFSFLDLDQLTNDFDLANTFPKSNMIGRAANEIVINNGNVIGQSAIFFGPNNKIWPGPIVLTQTGQIQGRTKDGRDVVLRRELIPNSKIQDFRNFETLQDADIDFSLLESELAKINIVNPRKEGFGFKNPKGYFSEITFARDQQGNTRFFFSIDYRKLLQDNSPFAKLLEREEAMENILLDSAILSMKIFRRRVQGSPEIGSREREDDFFITNPVGYGRNFVDKTISTSGEKAFGLFSEVSQLNGSLREIEDVAFINAPVGSIRHFTGVDTSIKKETDGYYRYGVELEIKDAGFEFLKQTVLKLERQRLRLRQYLSEAASLGASQNQIPLMNPHVDVPFEDFLEKGEQKRGNFDPTLNRFSQRFIDEQRRRYYNGQRVSENAPWLSAIISYIDALRIFTDSPLDFELIQQQLLYFTNPVTGTPAGIEKLLFLIEDLQKNIETEIGISSFGRGISGEGLQNISSVTKDKGVSKSRISRANSTRKSFSISFLFREVLNSNQQPGVGFDFLDIPEEQSDNQNVPLGIKIVSGEQYEQRTIREIDTYFNGEPNTNIDISIGEQFYSQGDVLANTQFTFLSPAKIKFGNNNEIQRIGNSPNPLIPTLQYQNIGFQLRQFNTSIFSEKVPQLRKEQKQDKFDLKSQTVEYFNVFNVSTETLSSFERNLAPKTEKSFPLRAQRPQQEIDPLPERQVRTCNQNDALDDPNTDPTELLLELAKRTPLEPRTSLIPSFGRKPTEVKPPAIIASTNVFDLPVVQTQTPPVSTLSLKSRKFSLENVEPIEQTISSFDLANEQNTLNKLTRQPSLINSAFFFQGQRNQNITLDDAVKELPNQIKSLFLQRTKPNLIKTNWLQLKNDPLKGVGNDVRFKFDYQLLRTIEVLKGYEVDKKGRPIIRKPIWEPLKREDYENATGQAIICRMMPYENKILNIKRAKDIEISTFDECFILTPQTRVEQFGNIAQIDRVRQRRQRSSEGLLALDQRQFDIRTEYISTETLFGEEN